MKSLLDPTFRYTPAHETDIRRTFARVRRQLATEARRKVVPLTPKAASAKSA